MFVVSARKGPITLKYRPIIAAALILVGVVLLYTYVSSGNEDHSVVDGKTFLGKTKILLLFARCISSLALLVILKLYRNAQINCGIKI